MNIVKWQRPTLSTWPGFGRLSDLRDEIDRLFDSPLNELTRPSQLLSGWTPALDVYEDKDSFIVKAELPGMKKEEINRRVQKAADSLQLTPYLDRYPKALSGGQRQRVAIARALALQPRLIVCDEPVSALDLSTQARVLDLLLEIQEQTGVSYLFVSHDLDVIRHISHRVAVMYRGEIVEQGESVRVTESPEHPYTRRLMLASPVPDPDQQAKRREERREFAASMVAELGEPAA